MRRRFWWRRKHLLLRYATIAVGASGLALTGGYMLLLSLAHMMHRG